MKDVPIPEIALKHGMTRLVFEDDFDSPDTIDVNDTRQPGYKWYVSRAYGQEPSAPENYKVENSVLTLQAQQGDRTNWTLCSMEWQSQIGYAFHQGVLEFRVRIPVPDRPEGAKGWPCVWSFPPKKLNNTIPEFVEVDWMEYWGYGQWTTTFHHMKRDPKRNPVEYFWLENPYNMNVHCFNDKEWHTMTFLWVDGKIEGWVDDVPCIKQTFYENQLPDPLPYVDLCGNTKEAFKILNSPDHPEVLILGGTKFTPLEMDWIRVWQK